MRRAAVMLALLLAGCDSTGDDATGGNAAVPAAPAQPALDLAPGQWQVGFTLRRVSAPGAPPELAAKVAAQDAALQRQPQSRTRSVCLTAAEVENAAGNVLTGTDGARCRFARLARNGTRIDGVLSCRHPGDAAPATATIGGTMMPQRYDLALAMKVSGGRGGDIALAATTVGERTGECTAGDGAPPG